MLQRVCKPLRYEATKSWSIIHDINLHTHWLRTCQSQVISKQFSVHHLSRRREPAVLPSLVSFHGAMVESVASYKYFSIVIDNSLSFQSHIDHLLKKMRFLFRSRSCFSLTARKRLDYGDLIYTKAPAHSPHLLGSDYHGALRLATHHSTLHSTSRRMVHWFHFIYKFLFGPFLFIRRVT